MADTYYAWSNIQYAKPSGDVNAAGLQPMEAGSVKVGETVTADQVGASEEDFQAMVDSGAVRNAPYPEVPEGWPGSPIDYLREAVRLVGEQAMSLTGTVNESLLRTTMSGPLPETEDDTGEAPAATTSSSKSSKASGTVEL